MKLQHAEVVTSAISAINLGKALRSDPTEVHSMRSLNDRAYCLHDRPRELSPSEDRLHCPPNLQHERAKCPAVIRK